MVAADRRAEGIRAYREGHLTLAIAAFTIELAHHPDDAELHYLLGLAQYHAGRTAAAIASFSQAAALDPSLRIARYHLAIAHARAGRLENAISIFEELMASGEDAAVHYHLGAAHYALGNLGAAERHFSRSVTLDPDDERSRRFLRMLKDPAMIKLQPTTRPGLIALLRGSLMARVVAASLLVTLFGLIAFTFYAERADREDSRAIAAREADATATAIENGIIYSMENSRHLDLSGIFHSFIGDPYLVSVRLFAKSGRVLASTDTEDVGRTYSRESLECRRCHEGVSRPLAAWGEIEQDAERGTLRQVRSLSNTGACRHCHVDGPPILAMLDLVVSTRAETARLRERQTRTMLFALLMALVMTVVMSLVINRTLRPPLDALEAAVRRVAGGELDVEAPETGISELNALQRSLNVMTTELRRSRYENLGWTRTLERKVEEATSRLRSAYDELRDFDQRKAVFVQRVVHELRAPLNSMLSLLRACKQGLLGEMNAQQLDFIDRAEHRGRAMTELIDDLLNLERLRAGELPLVFVTINVGALMTQVLAEFAPKAGEAGVRLRFEKTSGDRFIRADQSEITTALSNLVGNAVKYTPAGGDVVVRVEASGDRIAIEIQDTGIGIPAEDRAHVFGEFFRAANARKRVQEGTGLGLALVKRIVEMHGGDIAIDCPEAGGTRVRLTLPAVARLNDSSDNQPESTMFEK